MADGEKKQVSIEHLEWAIQSRARNQQTCLRLLRSFERHEKRWQTRKYAPIAQDLLAVAFSLWRAAFLADRKGNREEVFANSRAFLRTLIEDNAITYAQDKNSREWTFNFYTRNARYALEHLNNLRSDLAPEYVLATRTAKERWTYCQELLDAAVTSFDNELAERAERSERNQKKREARANRRQRRRTVRALTLGKPR
jgi:hypothetical protein